MSSEHALRWKSAVVMLLVIFTVGLIDNRFLTWLFFGAVLYFAVDEANRLFKVDEVLIKIKDITLPFTTAYALTLWVGALFIDKPIYLFFILLMILASKLAYDKSIDIKLFLPLLYPIMSILFIWNLYIEFGVEPLIWLLVIVALSDVGAYYVGKNFGKTPFSPTSPKKTLEGVFGGVGVATLVGGSLIAYQLDDINFIVALIIAFFTSLSGVFGDLFESYLKREAGVKDSGNLIPGHGGMLDRVDGYLFAGITLYILISSLMG